MKVGAKAVKGMVALGVDPKPKVVCGHGGGGREVDDRGGDMFHQE